MHTKRLMPLLPAMALLLSLAIVSLPILKAGYYSDDNTNSLVNGTIRLYHTGFWRLVCEYMNYWLGFGRFFPISVISSTAVFTLTHNAFQYQMVRLVFIWLSLFSFATLSRVISGDKASFWWMLLLVPTCWSFRDTPDALTSFAIFLPLVAIFCAWTMIFLCHYLKNPQPILLDGSLVMYALGLMCYEVSLVTLGMVLVCVLRQKITQHSSFQILRPYLLLTLTYLVIYLFIQSMGNSTYNGIKFGLNPLFFRGFFTQLGTALPLSFWWMADHKPLAVLIDHVSLTTALLFLSAFFSSISLLRRGKSVQQDRLGTLILFGVLLICFPAMLVGLSEKYQILVSAGRGYIPVYMQYFGTGFLLLAGLHWLNKRLTMPITKTLFQITASLCLASVLCVSGYVNEAVVTQNNEDYYNERGLLETALQLGILSPIPTNAWLVEKLLLWNPHPFYAMKTNLPLAGVLDLNDPRIVTATFLPGSLYYYLETFHLPRSQEGYVLVGKIQSIHLLRKALTLTDRVTLKSPWAFVTAKTPEAWNAVMEALHARLGEPVPPASRQFHPNSPSCHVVWQNLQPELPIHYEISKKLPYLLEKGMSHADTSKADIR